MHATDLTTPPRKRILMAVEGDGRRLLAAHIGALETRHEIVPSLIEDAAAVIASATHSPPFDALIVAVERRRAFDTIAEFRARCDGPVVALSGSLRREHVEATLQASGVGWWLPSSTTPETLMFWVNQALFPIAHRSRRFPRVPAERRLEVRDERRDRLGRALNLGVGGMYLATTRSWATGDVFDVRFVVPTIDGGIDGSNLVPRAPARLTAHRQRHARSRGSAVRARCQVVRVDRAPQDAAGAPYGLGLRFLEIDLRSRGCISAFVLEAILDSTV